MAENTAQIEALYSTHALPPQSKTRIRVFVVQLPRPDGEANLVRGDFQVIDLGASPTPQFTALSYVWGVDQNFRTVDCGGTSLQVTQNCLDALLHLRKRLGSFTIWIDAICINQRDEAEKTRQLQFMHRIYTLAHTTYVWLGTGTEETDRAMNYFSRGGLIDFLDFSTSSTPTVPSRRRRWEAIQHYTISHLCKSQMLPIIVHNPTMVRWRLNPKSKARSAFSSSNDVGILLSKSWIRRIWTFQEILLASNPIVVCGDKHVSWTRLIAAVLFLQQQRYLGLPQTLLQTWERMHGCRIFVQKTLEHQKASNETPPGDDGASLDSVDAIVAYQNLVSSTLRGYRHIHKTLKWVFNLGFIVGLALIGAIVTSIRYQYPTGAVAGICIAHAAGCFIFPLLNWALDTMDYQRPVKAKDSIPESPQFDLVDGVLNRYATSPYDKAFGLRAVVQQMMSDREIPRPDYRSPLGDVYKESTTLLIQATGQLGAILPAAVQRIPGQPSWVADWSKDIENIWVADLIGTNVKYNRTLAPEHFHNSATSARYEFDKSNPNLLRFRGKQIGHVATCFQFEATKPDYDEHEAGIHHRNLMKLIVLMGFPYRFKDATKNKYYIRHVSDHWRIQLYKLAASPGEDNNAFKCPVPDRPPFERWCDTLKTLYQTRLQPASPDQYFTGQNPAINQEQLKLQIWLCNGLVRARQQLARFEWRRELMGDMQMRFYAGFCTAEARAGDKVIAVPGVGRLLIVREATEPSSSTVELISPAILYHLREEEMSWSPDEPLDEFSVV